MSSLKNDIRRIEQKYPGLRFASHDETRDFVNIHNILEATFENVDPTILMDAFLNRDSVSLKTANDYYYLITTSLIKNADLTKKAYPIGMGALSENPWIQADMEKWVSLVHKIYSAVESGDMTFHHALDYYSGTLNTRNGEDVRFKKWITYYKDGQHQKYSEEDQIVDIKKESDYQFGLSSNFYPGDSVPHDESISKKLKELEDKDAKGQMFEEWKSKLNGAIRRLDKLLRTDEHLSPEEQQDLAEMLHAFDLQVRRVRLQSTGEDLTFQAASLFKKLGYDAGSDLLMKAAQDLGAPEVPGADTGLEAPEAPAEAAPNTVPGQEPAAAGGPGEAIERVLTSGEPPVENHGAVFDELAQTGGQINLGEAAVKLEEVAARLADRRTIRQLAEFDIMLDKLGIASLFPELAEAQSKLIDAYSYALVRVTKMLGMLSSGKSMAEISEAKTTDISNKAIKEVNKTFNQGEEQVAGGKGTEALSQEFGPGQSGQEAQPIE